MTPICQAHYLGTLGDTGGTLVGHLRDTSGALRDTSGTLAGNSRTDPQRTARNFRGQEMLINMRKNSKLNQDMKR